MPRNTKVVAVSMLNEDIEWMKAQQIRPTDLVREMIAKLRKDENDRKA